MLRLWSVRSNPHIISTQFLASSSSSSSRNPTSTAMSRSTRIAIIGDVHDQWDLEEDSKALQFLQPDLVLLTGDYANENVELVRSISRLDIPKCAILGNHDSWQTHQFSVKKVDRIQRQLQCLGEEHVGYSRMDFPSLNLSVVGGRPFSCGGERLFRPKLISARYGVNDMEESANKIFEAALGTPDGHSVVLLAHNGPTGLGSNMNDICGRDWIYGGGDHGDPDLAQAVLKIKSSAHFSIPLVVFGHMHKALRYGGERKMIVLGTDGTIYLNAAIVPRVKYPSVKVSSSSTKGASLRNFTMVEIAEGKVEKIAETWVSVDENLIRIEEEIVIFESI